ncbi:MFS transporter [Hymenobacter cavernae]|uniref:Major facilitator superfamily (MFS) profile domain-containing protein n=1 Tax=Hymenobacter cavernae TaxID=2044852 RepID=A0ABQ1U5K7_9BACT|nr:MFS transporter [Hymenobacter cavernae]GGF10942.1 hypothetical protein GCM10011383_22700 [Hymenobacter cavernae]
MVYEKRIAHPFLNPSVLRHKPLSVNLLAGLLVYAVLIATSIVLTFYLTGAMHYSPAQVGLILSVGPLTTALLSTTAGRLSDRYGARPVMLAGAVLLVLGSASLITLSPNESS